jgi:hypothetical protein
MDPGDERTVVRFIPGIGKLRHTTTVGFDLARFALF